MLSTHPDFSSETDIRKSRLTSVNPSASPFARNTIQHSTSSSTLRTSDSSSVYHSPMNMNFVRSQSVHPDSRSLTTSLLSNSKIALTRKSITEYPNRTFRVIFSDDSIMIIREDSLDGQIFIDTQGKRYSFDRRQAHQPEAIQERLALFYQNEHDLAE